MLAFRTRVLRQRPTADAPPSAPEPPSTTVSIAAFGQDCRLSGQLELRYDRLAELLNSRDPIELSDAQLDGCIDGQQVELAQSSELAIERGELCAVVATGPTGDPSRRLHTRPVEVALTVGPYVLRGSLHGRAGTDPLCTGLDRRTFVALTDAEIEGGPAAAEGERYPTLLVNRSLVRTIERRAVTETAHSLGEPETEGDQPPTR